MLLASDDESAQALIHAIEADPYDSNALSIYGDWLQARGEPRGELVSLQIAAEHDHDKRGAAHDFLLEHSQLLLGPLARFHAHDPEALTWRYGFIHRARFDRAFGTGVDALTSHPSGRFVVEITTGPSLVESDPELERCIELLATRALRTLHVLQLGVNRDPNLNVWRTGTHVEKLWPALPRLRRLVINGGHYRYGALDLPLLEHAEFRTGGLNRRNLAEIASSRLPLLRHLDLIGDHDLSDADLFYRSGRPTVSRCASRIEHVERFFETAQLPALRHLGIKQCLYTDEVCRSIRRWRGLRSLETLDLSGGFMTDAGAQRLAMYASEFRHLAVLDVSMNHLSATGVAALRGIAHRVIAGDQRPV